MVLSMATIANAGLVINVNGVNPPDSAITLLPSETVAISIVGDGQSPYSDYFLINTQAGSATMAGLHLAWAGNLANAAYARPADQIPMLQSLGYNTTNAIFMGLYDSAGLPLVGTIIDEVILHCDTAPNDVLLTLIDLTWVYDPDNDIYVPVIRVEDTQIIHQIPEPMTMALLGLGGLFLRRRK